MKDEITGETAGQIDADGNTGETDSDTTARLGKALDPGGEATEEFGICFGGVCSTGPRDPGHDALVMKHLGALTGLRPRAKRDPSYDRERTAE